MGEVTPGRPIRRHCHYKHPSGKNGAGDKQTAQQSQSSVLAGSGLPQLTRLTYLYCASFPTGDYGV